MAGPLVSAPDIKSDSSKCSPVAVDVVVKRQLLVLPDESAREDAHAHVATDRPLGHIAVGITAVIRKPPNSTTLRRVNELRLLFSRC